MVADNGQPDPTEAVDLAEFIKLLGRLRTWAGQPPFRSLARQVGPLMRPPQQVPVATVADVFKVGRRRLDIDLVAAIVRALGLDEDTVTLWRDACVRVHAEAKTGGPTGVFRQLPPDLATFTGREDVLRRLLDTATRADQDPANQGSANAVPILAVEGMPGVGKTQLAVRAAHTLVRAGRFTDAQLYVNLRGFDRDRLPANPSEVLEGFLRALEVPSQRIPDSVDERAAMFRDRLHGRSALVLLDNAANENQVRDLIPADPGCLVLITSRRALIELPDAVGFHLDVFGEDEAVALLARIAGQERVDAQPESARRIVHQCGMLPLAVSLVASRLRSRRTWQLSDAAERLEEEKARSRTIGGSAFNLSYRELPDPPRSLFRMLGFHPGLDFTAFSVAAPVFMQPFQAGWALEMLLDENLLQQSAAGRYEIHDLLRAFAAERADAELPERKRGAILHRALSWHVAVVTRTALAISPDRVLPPIDPAVADSAPPQALDSAEAVLWYGRERANLMEAVAVAGRLGIDSVAWRLPVAMAYFEELAQNYRELERLMTAALPHARADDDPDAETDVVRWLSFALSAQGRAAESIEPLHRVIEARRAAGDGLRAGRLLGSLALVHATTDDPGRGLELALEAIATIEQTGGPVPSMILTITSTCLSKLGRDEEALEYQVVFVDRSRKADDLRAVALGQRNVGATLLTLGRLPEAAEALAEAAGIAGEVGDRYVRADCLNGLALVLLAEDKAEEARAQHRKALAVFDDLPDEEAARYRAQLDGSSLRYSE